MLIHEIWVWGGYAGVVLVSLLAFWRGGWAERSAAATILIAWILTPFAQDQYNPSIAGVAIDTATAIILVGISLKSRRLWTLFAAASMLGAVVCHIMVNAFDEMGYFSYITALGVLSGLYLILALGLGVWEHQFLVRNNRRVGLLAGA